MLLMIVWRMVDVQRHWGRSQGISTNSQQSPWLWADIQSAAEDSGIPSTNSGFFASRSEKD